MPIIDLHTDFVAEQLSSKFPEEHFTADSNCVWVPSAIIANVCSFLKTEKDFRIDYLNSITAVDFIDHFAIVYHLSSIETQNRITLKCHLYGRDDLSIDSVLNIWQGADFQEREIWDLMGIKFNGRPNMKRLLLWEGFEGHPLRKDFL
ncbi:MAG TPA: NADH-quinone oxidoreductase subunit C [Dehalococcoidia bacterium]|jgi:NADH-quinone oxidoreductase subunit C|nr:NADH-quinone oxidoreductase subunit C [Dehalococcoidia bacterium]|tara:strand:+ start:158 stop:601 length:444 start_codon:yes stop_codon:yes gene_type:complete